MSGESRMALIHWINNLLQIGYTRVEQCGTGAVLCQIFDSIYGDVNLSKVKFNSNQEYEYVLNFKVLQSCFAKHHIQQPVPVERLIKCKFQDNLEFLQWVKKYWDQHFNGGPYDAIARRRGAQGSNEVTSGNGGSYSGGSVRAAGRTSRSSEINSGSRNSPIKSRSSILGSRKVNQNINNNNNSSFSNSNISNNNIIKQKQEEDNHNAEQLIHLENELKNKDNIIIELQEINERNEVELQEIRGAVEQLEKERGFYFEKLREIEIYIQQKQEDSSTDDFTSTSLKDIINILYKTEEGFEIPESTEEVVEASNNENVNIINDTNQLKDEPTLEEDSMVVDNNKLVEA